VIVDRTPEVEQATARLARLATDVAGIRGALVASVDGYALAHHLPHHDPSSTAAIVASSCALGAKLAELAGEGDLKEVVVHGAGGYVVIYQLEADTILSVLTAPSVNLAMLHLRARDLVVDLAELRSRR
jgi:predicted regulator of Ras-like GTPase activity (Roadblock/LC7/MglB family)